MNGQKDLSRALAALLLLSACEGEIGSGGGAAGDAPGTPMDRMADPSTCDPLEHGAPLRRLNREEIAFALLDVFELDMTALDAALPRDGRVGGFATVGSRLSSGELFTEAMVDVALEAAEGAIAAPDCLGEAECVSRELAPAMRLLFRRAPSVGELDALDRVALDAASELEELGLSTAEAQRAGLESALASIIASPSFLFLHREEASESARALTGTELAERLALGLWLSVPDDELLTLGESGELQQPDVLDGQLERMMADARFDRFIESFVKGWLTLERLDNSGVDPTSFDLSAGEWESLLELMREETTTFVRHIFESDAPLREAFTADYTFANAALADHYGLEGPRGDAFERVDLPAESDRRGLLTQGAVLSQATSGDQVSVVFRGEAVLAGFLCDPPPPPPESVVEEIGEILAEDPSEEEKMARRAADPRCAGCHASLDPVGWAFAGFDGVAAPSALPQGSGVLDGSNFSGVRELTDILTERGQYESCFTEKLLIHLVGRSFRPRDVLEDQCAIASIATGRAGESMRALLRATLLSDAFRQTGPLQEN